MPKKPSEKEYSTIQIKKPIKDQLVKYCDEHNHKIGKFVENLFKNFISGSRP